MAKEMSDELKQMLMVDETTIQTGLISEPGAGMIYRAIGQHVEDRSWLISMGRDCFLFIQLAERKFKRLLDENPELVENTFLGKAADLDDNNNVVFDHKAVGTWQRPPEELRILPVGELRRRLYGGAKLNG